MEIGSKPFIIAELSGNHGGSLNRAKAMIWAAAQAGCDAVKIQLYEPEDLCDPPNNHIYEQCKIPREWLPVLFSTAKEAGIPLFSSVFAEWAIDCLEKFDCPAYKLASPESTRLPEATYDYLASKIIDTDKMFFASSGQKDMPLIRSLCPDVLFYCIAGYPATLADSDINYFGRRKAGPGFVSGLKWNYGFSDHTQGIIAPLAMIAVGAIAIEKHFKLDDDCIDTAFSLNPQQMTLLCRLAHR